MTTRRHFSATDKIVDDLWSITAPPSSAVEGLDFVDNDEEGDAADYDNGQTDADSSTDEDTETSSGNARQTDYAAIPVAAEGTGAEVGDNAGMKVVGQEKDGSDEEDIE